MTKKKEKTLLEKIFNISPKASAELEDTKLSIDGKGDEDYGANAVPEHPTVETPSEKKAPTFDEIISGIREALADPSLEEERSGSVTRAQALADSLSASAGERDGAGAKKSDEIYSLLASLGERQSKEYDELGRFITSGNYLSTPAAKAILEQYMSAAALASGNAIAESAADNAGNPDSFGAANAHRQRIAYTDAGVAAALDLYERQADRLAEIIRSSGDGLSKIYSQMQDNADSDYDRAASSVDAVSEILSSLLKSSTDEKKAEIDAITDLYGKYAESTKDGEISPMGIDKEFDGLKRDGLSGTDALIELWKKYPEMRDYITDKYEQILRGDSLYIFNE